MTVTWARALAWRLGRQLLDPVGTGSVADIVERLGAVPAWPDLGVELVIGVRRADGRLGDVARALAAGDVVKVYGGATHLMTPQNAGAYLAVRASNRMWERPSWRSYYELEPSDWPRFREYVRTALADGPITHSELVAALRRSSRYRHLAAIIAGGNETLLKPLTWQGDMGLGPARDGEPTFLLLQDVPGWGGIPDLDQAGPAVVAAYFRSYGPATAERVTAWLCGSHAARRRDVLRWLAELDERLEPVTIQGDRVLMLADDVADLLATPASTEVRLLPGRDPWIMGPGTDDARVVPPAHRDVGGRMSNLVIWRGVVAGTWTLRADGVRVAWFTESGRVPRTALGRAVDSLAGLLDRPLDLTVG